MSSRVNPNHRRAGLEHGTTAVEYAILASIIAVFIIVAVLFFSGALKTEFSCLGRSIMNEANECGGP